MGGGSGFVICGFFVADFGPFVVSCKGACLEIDTVIMIGQVMIEKCALSAASLKHNTMDSGASQHVRSLDNKSATSLVHTTYA